ncbi:MAG: YbaB/EbfC family nucleoid-associated protein [Cellulomonadaceae bacterium]|nr:YbaB/EbfC family nucleoid-associated protein [Cellulomonadaceae bacterium]
MTPADSPEQALTQVTAQIEQAQERARRATELRQQVEQLSAEVRSPRQEIRVRVDAQGRLLDLELSEAALDLGPARLAALVVRTSATAHQRAAEQVGRLAEDAFGVDSDLARRVTAEVNERAARGPAPHAPEARL